MPDLAGADKQAGPTVTALLADGPLEGRRIDVQLVEARPPKMIGAPAEDGSACRYCLAEWAQSGPSAVYAFLYAVENTYADRRLRRSGGIGAPRASPPSQSPFSRPVQPQG